MIWDLQHRLQPYFPEVSEKGEWNKREAFFRPHLQRASAIIAGTKTGKSEIERFYQINPERIHILPHPTPQFALDPPESDFSALEKFNLPPKYLFYPAQFWAHKNHVLILKALQILKSKYGISQSVVFCGSDQGNLKYVKNTVRELQLESQVYFVGFVTRNELVDLYRNALAMTYVTYFGPENLPPLEAFALGCPVICSKVPGSTEQLGDAALFVDPGNEEQLAETIARVRRDPKLVSELQQKGRIRAKSFTPENFVTGVFELLDGFEKIRRSWGF